MKGFLTFILGIIGLASLVGAGFILYKGGGLVSQLKDHDSVLQSLETTKRAEVLENWVAFIDQEANALTQADRRATLGPSIGEVQASALSYFNRAIATVSKTVDQVAENWAESEEGTAKADKALETTENKLSEAVSKYDQLSDQDKVQVKADAAEAERALNETFSDEDVAKRPEIEERLARVRALLTKLQ